MKSVDYRRRVAEYRAEGHTVAETAKVFKVSETAIRRWCKMEALPDGYDTSHRQARKFDPDALKQLISENPELTLAEIAEVFGGSASGADYALRRNKISFKKDTDFIRRARRSSESGIRPSTGGFTA